MKKYLDINGDSGVEAYDTGEDYISVLFKAGSARQYLYTNTVTGTHHVENMKKLAVNGNGLNSYINRNVKKNYANKT